MGMIGFDLVPGYGGSTAVVYFVATVVPSALAAASVARRSKGVIERVAVAAVVLAVGVLGLTRLAAEVHTRNYEYVVERGVTYHVAEARTQTSVGVDPAFLVFLERHLPLQSFYMVTGPSIKTSGPQSWAQFELMPRIEEYNKPCRARWIVFFASAARIDGVAIGHPVLMFKPGYSLAKNVSPCTP